MFAEDVQEDLNRKVCLECNRQFTGVVTACPHDGTLLITVACDPLIGTVLADNYEIISVIGHGGMGVVYKARHTLMDRVVAIKMLQAQLISDSISVKRFQQEGKATSRISHPHVITVYHFGISPSGQPFIVMDYLQGVPLAHVIKEEGHVGVERTIRIMSQACDALEHAHRQGVIHRDLKPSNIVLIRYDDEKDFVKVVDFGVAMLMVGGQDNQRLTQAGEVCGSPVYMSPEQCQGLELDRRSDIYSMGIVLYETLTGRLPFLGKTMVETMTKHIGENPPTFAEIRPDLYIPERLESVVFRCLQKDRNERHQTMEDLKKDLELSIPRPAKSQVLRSTIEIPQAVDKASAILKGFSFKHWLVIASVMTGGLVAAFNLFMHMISPVVHPPVKTQKPASPVVAPPQTENAPALTPIGAVAPVSTTKASNFIKSGAGTQASLIHKPNTTIQTVQTVLPSRRGNTSRPHQIITKRQLDANRNATSIPARKHAYSTFSPPEIVESTQMKSLTTEPKKRNKLKAPRTQKVAKQVDTVSSELSMSVRKAKRDPWDTLWDLKKRKDH